MSTITIGKGNDQHDVSFTDIETLIPEGAELTPAEEIEVLARALADSVQSGAQIQNELAQAQIKHEKELEGMVKGDGSGQEIMDGIVQAIQFMNQRQDEKCYRTLESLKQKFGAAYGHKDIDPMSPEALL